MEKDKRKQIQYQKTDFNKYLICQLSTIIKCCKCKRYNTIQNNYSLYQNCLFCGTPNFNKERKI